MAVVFILLCYFQISLALHYSDKFTEELVLKPLVQDQIYAHFQFTTIWDVDARSRDCNELHISLTAGLWKYETWGYPILDSAPGAEVWVWFKDDTKDIDTNWKQLTNSLSGLLCASLNQIDNTNSINPDISFAPTGIVSNKVNSSFVRYSTLPREIVCTENLTPWKKLLPCDSKLGLATLLNAGPIHNTRYHSLSIHLRPICRNAECDLSSIELTQSVDLVYDFTILGTRNWSLRKLFGQGIMNSCPLAESSTIYVEVTNNDTNIFHLSPTPDEYLLSTRGGFSGQFAKYIIKERAMTISASYSDNQMYTVNIPPPLHANQYKIGYGQQKGGLVTKIYNNHWAAIDVVVLQNLPWYIPIYLHTLKINSNGTPMKPLKLIYKPGKMREKAHSLELVLRLPAKSTTSIKFYFDYVFLKWQEYPPDANHGFYIGSAIISGHLPLGRNYTGIPQDGSTYASSFNASRKSYFVQIRTEPIVITLPTPDFSMPYNVICLACTVVALAFGPLHNITTKRLVLKINSDNLLTKLKKFGKALFCSKKI
ncbi:gpi transamidase component pig-t-related [Holotrichia oblita]|uniref:Gpi transamidase component pig-t-related n=1 Tax=Holotrichia oblita TaxID=644536 RepID=A0ACB9TDF8_HOLOL|nr:gpi transamidase component pig-t-related [Holotrichia oblita]